MINNQHSFLKPADVARLGSIELRARLVVEGFMTGLHRSPYHGFSVEFAEHRQYHPGDDIRYMDWKIVGRTNRYYIKQFEEETNLRATIAVDTSASMRYASKGNISKFEYAASLAASLCYLMMRQQDASGLALYNKELQSFLPPRSKPSYLQQIFRTLGMAVPSEYTSTAMALHRLAEQLPRRGLIVLISDFFDDIESIIQALRHFRHDGHEVIAIQVLDPREKDFDFGLDASFRDMETGEELITQPFQIKRAYAEALGTFNQRLKQECRQRGVDYVAADTSQPYDIVLREYLHKRERM
jgi:uncharacterized protein (DUF58 family)